MTRFHFLLIAIGVLSSNLPSSQGFSTSTLSSTLKKNDSRQIHQQRSLRDSERRCFGRGNVLLHVATDPTTITSTVDADSGRSYDFISVEEAEEGLKRERARYEGERSELQWLLDVQRQQLQELADGRGENEGTGDRNHAATSSSRIVIVGAHAHVDANVMNNRRKNRKKNSRNSNNGNGRDNTNNDDGTYLRMEQLERRLQDAIIKNENLTRRLREQNHQYNVDRSMYEDELREERGRLNCVRDELHMERAYFDTTQQMLEHLLVEEQRKVQELENELLMMLTRDQVFSQDNQSHDGYQEQQRQQQSQKQHGREEPTQSQMNNENRNQQQKKGRGRTFDGFTMNINDVHSPLYP